eukprot:3538847-Pleurochrysis_carterae.AAC.1
MISYRVDSLRNEPQDDVQGMADCLLRCSCLRKAASLLLLIRSLCSSVSAGLLGASAEAWTTALQWTTQLALGVLDTSGTPRESQSAKRRSSPRIELVGGRTPLGGRRSYCAVGSFDARGLV